MKAQKLISLIVTMVVISMLAAACAPAATPAPAAPAATQPPAAPAGKPYIPVISKGFQHQFWQAVKKGAE